MNYLLIQHISLFKKERKEYIDYAEKTIVLEK